MLLAQLVKMITNRSLSLSVCHTISPFKLISFITFLYVYSVYNTSAYIIAFVNVFVLSFKCLLQKCIKNVHN